MTTAQQNQQSIDPLVFAASTRQFDGWVTQEYDQFTVGDRIRRIEHLPDGLLRITEGVVARVDGDRLYSSGDMILATKRHTMLEFGTDDAATFTQGQDSWVLYDQSNELLEVVEGIARVVHTSVDGTKQMTSSAVITATKDIVRNVLGATIVAERQLNRPGVWLEYKKM